MRRTQDIAMARLRLLAARWRIPPAPGGGESAGATQPAAEPREWAEHEGSDPAEHDGAEPAEPRGSGPAEPLGPDPADPAGPADGPRTPPALLLPLLGLLVVGVLVVAGVLLVRSWPRPQGQVAPEPSAAALLAPIEAFATASPTPRAPVVVHVVGAVRRPGVVTLPAGARVADAVRAAGGLRKGGRLGATNLARPLVDGERVEIGAAAEGGADGAAAGAPGGPTGSAGPLDLNTATAAQLDLLPGVGPVTAAKILAWRGEHGRFSSVDELAEVPGIGPKTLEQLRPLVRA